MRPTSERLRAAFPRGGPHPDGPRLARPGVTLLELLVALALLGVVLAVGGVAVARSPRREAPDDTVARIADARRSALRRRARVTIELHIAGRPVDVTALPNGSVLADSGVGVDRLTGESAR